MATKLIVLYASLIALMMPYSAAADITQCTQVACIYDPLLSPFDEDYTVPTDGKLYRWDFRFTSLDPNATISLDSPTQLDSDLVYFLGAGNFQEVFNSPFQYTFSPTFRPGLLSIIVGAPKNFDNCSNPTEIGLCSANYNVWGNGTRFIVTSNSPVSVLFSSTAVPEPAGWILAILGFGALGMRFRRRPLSNCRA